MQKVTIKSTFSPNLGGIQDLQGMPILQTGKDVQNRILNFFYKAFGYPRNMLNFIGKDPKEVKKFEKDLLKMVYGKDAKYPVVAFDGYADDSKGKDDIAIYLDMGIPRLRGRTINYLDRIYVKIRKNMQMSPNLRFYCSPHSFTEWAHPNIIKSRGFDIRDKYEAWHPHISDTKPCLGGFEAILYDNFENGDSINYLNSINAYLNTWNRMSPYWNINSKTITHKVGNYKFKGSLMKWAKDRYLTTRMSNKVDMLKYLEYVESDSISYALKFVCNNISRCFAVFQQISEEGYWNLGEDINHSLEVINHEYCSSRESGKFSFSAMPIRVDDTYTRMRTLYTTTSGNSNTITLVPNSDSTSFKNMLYFNKRYNYGEVIDLRETVHCLQRVISKMYSVLNMNSFLYEIINTDNIIKESIVTESKYIEPIRYELREFYDNLDKKANRTTRASLTSSYSGQTEKEHDKLLRRKDSRINFVRNRLLSICKQGLSNEVIQNSINKKMRDMFAYDLAHRYNIGAFWARRVHYGDSMDVSKKEKRLQVLKQIGGVPKSLEDLLYKYNKLKQEYLLIENDILRDYYSKIVRRLDKNELKMQITNTEKSPEQVQLSFD